MSFPFRFFLQSRFPSVLLSTETPQSKSLIRFEYYQQLLVTTDNYYSNYHFKMKCNQMKKRQVIGYLSLSPSTY